MKLDEKVKQLPSSPGVYLMKDAHGHIIYVGKSKILKQRVQSYFHHSAAHSPKTKRMVKNLRDFDYILTDTEFEAFMLECQLIKEMQPHYNRKMKNHRSYTYIVFRTKGSFRRIEIINGPTNEDNDVYFGPYSSRSTVERAVQGLKECFKLNCNQSSPRNTLCLNYSLGQCIGMCLGGPTLETYEGILNQIIDLLHGTDESLLEEMKQRMLGYAETCDFETAARYRDYIDALHSVMKKEKVIDFTEKNQNIVIIEGLPDHNIKLFLLKRSTILFRGTYPLCIDKELLRNQIRTHIVSCFTERSFPEETHVSRAEIDEAQIVYSYLKSSSCRSLLIPDPWLVPEEQAHLDEELRGFMAFLDDAEEPLHEV